MTTLRRSVIGGLTLLFTPWTLSAQMWGETGYLSAERWQHTASLLPSGEVLIVGGSGGGRLSSAEIFDPLTGTWETAADSGLPRKGHTATTLLDGTVLIAGGLDDEYLADARIYDPKCEADDVCEVWKKVGSLATSRAYHTATLMPSGEVMVAGGFNGTYLSTVELYDPETGSWQSAGGPNDGSDAGLEVARSGHTATLLASGEVLVTGGTDGRRLGSVEIYDPESRRWTLAGSGLNVPRVRHVAVRLASGKVLVVGGRADDQSEGAEVYDPASKTWKATRKKQFPREGHTATLLPNGNVIVAGGRRGNAGSPALIFLEDKNNWRVAAAPATLRSWHTATRLATGDVLFVGGVSEKPQSSKEPDQKYKRPQSSVELYQTERGKWSVGAFPEQRRKEHTATLIAGGKVLVVGGDDGDETLASAQIYDHRTRTWSPAGELSEPRKGHTATLLASGDLLVTGGVGGGSQLRSSELYDVSTGQWRAVGGLRTPREKHTATRLPSGKVLVAGGDAGRALGSVEIYDPASGKWKQAAALGSPRHSHSATLLPSGRVFVAGGRAGNALSTAEVYNPETDDWHRVGDMPGARSEHAATLLPSGDVLVTGGLNGKTVLAGAAVYRPASGDWASVESLDGPRHRHTSTLLSSGRVLVVGGYKEAGKNRKGSFEVYQPSTRQWSKGRLWPSTVDFFPRAEHTATLLPSGEVLVVGKSGFHDVILYRPPLFEARDRYARIQQHQKRLEFGAPFTLTTKMFAPDSVSGESDVPIVHLRSFEGESQHWLPIDLVTGSPQGAVDLSLEKLPASINHGPHLISVMAGGRQSAARSVDMGCVPWVAPLSDQKVRLKEPATFTVESQGGRFFQWFIKKPGEKDFVELPGATEPSYTTPAIAADDFGTEYYVQVSTGCDSTPSNAARLTIDDQTEPTVSLTLPAGGEKWLLSSRVESNEGRIAWTMDDDAMVCQVDVHLLYSDDSGSTWSATGAATLLDEIGDVENCLYPGQKRTEMSYSIPRTPPSGRQGSLYRVEVLVTDQAGNVSRPATSAKPFHIIKTSPVRNTLIVTNFSRMQQTMGVSDQQIGRLEVALKDFAEHSSVIGEILELDQEQSIRSLYERWDGGPKGANDLLFADGGIQGHIVGHVQSFQGVENVVIVGDDSIIPMARFTDRTLYDESRYQSAVPPGSTVHKALAAKQYLSDDPLAVRYPIQRDELNRHFLPELNVGRLVETPEEIVQSIATFLGQDGVLDLKSPADKVLVTAYDFLQDSGGQIRDRWLGAYEGRAGKPVDGDLISRDWKKKSVDERRALLHERMGARGRGILSLNGHASHEAKHLPGLDPRGAGLTAEAMSDLDLEGSVVYTVGCHGGLTVPGGSPDDRSLDLPQTFLNRGALAYLGNSGFGWGLTTGIGMSELLAVLFTQELTYGPEVVSIGDAVRRAKERFFYESTIWDEVYDVKTSHQWTLYGFPMYSIKTDARSPEMIRRDAMVDARAGQVIDVERRVLATPNSLPSNLTRLALQLNFAKDSYTKWGVSALSVQKRLEDRPGCPGDVKGCYYTLNGLFERASGESDLPIEPYFVYETRLAETSARDVLWLGGPYDEEPDWKPVFADLQSSRTESRDRKPLPARKLVVAPRKPHKPRRSTDDGSELRCQAVDDEINRVVMTTGELIKYKSAGGGAEKLAHRLHTGIDLEMFFFSDPSKSDKDCDRKPPKFAGKNAVQDVNDGSSLHWTVSMDGNDDVWRVVVVWDDEYANRWRPVELALDPQDGKWKNSISLDPEKAEKMSELTYVVQAVDRHGNVQWLEKSEPTSTGPVTLPVTTGAEVPIGRAALETTLAGPKIVELDAVTPFEVKISNSGPQKATRVKARVVVPRDSSAVAISGRGWNCGGEQNVLTCEKKKALKARADSRLLVYLKITDRAAVERKISACASAMERNPKPDLACSEYSFGIRNSRVTDMEVVNAISDLEWSSETEVSFKLTVKNNGPNLINGATFTADFPPVLEKVLWTAVGAGGHTARKDSKKGKIHSVLSTEAGGEVVYTVTATFDLSSKTGNDVIVAKVDTGDFVEDPDKSNNQFNIPLKLEPPAAPAAEPEEEEETPEPEGEPAGEENGGSL